MFYTIAPKTTHIHTQVEINSVMSEEVKEKRVKNSVVSTLGKMGKFLIKSTGNET